MHFPYGTFRSLWYIFLVILLGFGQGLQNDIEQQFKLKDIELGITDGIHIEIKSGINLGNKMKIWSQKKQDKFAN